MSDDTERSPGSWPIRVECDEPSRQHPKKRPVVAVTNFVHIGTDREGDSHNGRWTENNRSPYLQKTLGAGGGLPDSGTTLVGDEVPTDRGGVLPSDEVLAATRSVYALACSKCRQPPDRWAPY